MISKLSGIFQMTANFPDDFKTVRIFPDECQFSGWFQNCPNFPDDCKFSGLFQNCPDFSRWLPRTFPTYSLAMLWEARVRFLGLSWETVSRTLSGKFLRVESCYPESLGVLRLCLQPSRSTECQNKARSQKYPGRNVNNFSEWQTFEMMRSNDIGL